MKFEQLIADSDGRLTYGLDAAGGVWHIGHASEGIVLWAKSLTTVDIGAPEETAAPVKCGAHGCPVCASGLGHE